MDNKIEIIIDDKRYSVEEAKALWLRLNELFDKKEFVPFYPYYPPQQPFWVTYSSGSTGVTAVN